MKTAAIVMAHAGTEDTCHRHYPYWRANVTPNFDHIFFLSPFDMQMDGPFAGVAWGKAQHHGQVANARFRQAVKMALGTGADRVVIHEYDSICLGTLPDTPKDAIAGNAFKAAPQLGFLGTTFIHPPIIAWRPALQRLCDILEVENMNGESGFWDRLLGHVCDKNSIPIWNYRDAGLGYSQNTIHPEHYEELRSAVQKGARLFHGIKNAEALDLIVTTNARPRRSPRVFAC